MNEKQRRIVYAAEANHLGRGGKSLIYNLVNISRSTLEQGMKDLFSTSKAIKSERIREGRGRQKTTVCKTAGLLDGYFGALICLFD